LAEGLRGETELREGERDSGEVSTRLQPIELLVRLVLSSSTPLALSIARSKRGAQ
jgi:hypothetical protein